LPGHSLCDAFENDIVLPTVSEIITIDGAHSGFPKIRRHRNFPTGMAGRLVLKPFLVGNPNLHELPRLGIADPEEVQVGVPPPH
jgi:hypothetical protein